MDYSKCPVIIHGSSDSLDVDAYMIVPAPLQKKEGQDLAKMYPELNISFLVVEDGKVTWSQKGLVDECNNSLLRTYSLHKQDAAIPVTQEVPRQKAIKMLHTVRGLLTHCSRTQHREEVKVAISSVSFEDRINLLEKIKLSELSDFEKKTPVETYKFMAFQLGQSLSLIKDGVELFTKREVADFYPELEPYLYRKEGANLDGLQKIWDEFTQFLKQECKPVQKQEFYFSEFGGVKEVWHAKKEVLLPPVAIFDIDGTIMDDTHRANLRDTKQWDQYFEACDKDTPIQKVVDLINDFKQKGFEIWLLTGRSESVKEKTLKSLEDAGVEFDHLKMRGVENKIKDFILKPAWVDKYIGRERVEFVLDDQQHVIDAFRKKGLNVINVTDVLESSNKASTEAVAELKKLKL